MWTLKKLFKDILGDYNSLSFNEMSSMQIFDFSTLYNIILHANLKTRSKEIIAKKEMKQKYHTDERDETEIPH
jgi:hypothetical protein